MIKYLICFVLLILAVFSCSLFYENDYNYTLKCTGSEYNRTCMYKNIYYKKGKWIVKNMPKDQLKCVAIRSRSSGNCFKPIRSESSILPTKHIKGLSVYASLFYTGNVGHLIWDDLYSMYLSILKFNYKLDPFNIILSNSESQWRTNNESRIFEIFSMNKLLYESDMQNDIVLIDTLIVGLSHHCQRCVNKEYSIAGGKEYKATWWMRKRVYFTYNIRRCEKRYGIIVDNKRYTEKEKIMLNNITSLYRNIFEIKYIDWKRYKDFQQQLKILSCTSIYISGPGTGLLNFPFMSDPGIVINLGGLFRGCPSFMEQYMEEGSMHFISLYYPSNKRKFGIKDEEIRLLIDKGINILNNWNIYKSRHKSNLNIEGEIFRNISKKYPDMMEKFLEETDWAKDYGYGVWAEKLVYFPYCYNKNYIINAVINETNVHKNDLGCDISNSNDSCLLKES